MFFSNFIVIYFGILTSPFYTRLKTAIMNFYAAISLVSAITTFYTGLCVFNCIRRKKLNQTFLLYSLTVAYISFTQFAYHSSLDRNTAYIWLKLGSVWPFIITLLLHLILVLVGKSSLLKNRVFLLALHLPAVLIFLLDLTTELITAKPIESVFGWAYPGPRDVYVMTIVFMWALIIGMISLFYTLMYLIKARSITIRRQAFFILIGVFTPYFFIGVLDFTSTFLQYEIPDISSLGFVIGNLYISYGLWKYQIFSLTTAFAAENVLFMMSDMFFLVSRRGKIINVNSAACRSLRSKRSDLIGKNIRSIVHRKDKSKFFSRFLKLVKKQGEITDMESTVRTKIGKKMVVSLSASCLYDDNNVVRGIILIARDITRRKRIEERLKRSYQILEEKNKDLRKMTDSMIGRELKMSKLKTRIKNLSSKSKRGKKKSKKSKKS